jgi:hypothetical protein
LGVQMALRNAQPHGRHQSGVKEPPQSSQLI